MQEHDHVLLMVVAVWALINLDAVGALSVVIIGWDAACVGSDCVGASSCVDDGWNVVRFGLDGAEALLRVVNG